MLKVLDQFEMRVHLPAAVKHAGRLGVHALVLCGAFPVHLAQAMMV